MARLGFVSLVAMLVLGGCLETAGGELRIESSRGERLVFSPSVCIDGDEFGFFGVELRDGDAAFGQFVGGERGPAFLFFARGWEAFRVTPEDCVRYDGEIERHAEEVTDWSRVHGEVTLNCETPRGQRLEGTLHFERCGPQEDEDDD